MTYITHGNYKGARWFPRCCCEDCEVIRDRFIRIGGIDPSRWEEIRGSWGTHSGAQAAADNAHPLQESSAPADMPALVVGVQDLPDNNPDFYTITEVTIKTGAQPIFVVDFTDAVTDTYHAVRVTYDNSTDDEIIVAFFSYDGTTATQLGGHHIIDWLPTDAGDYLKATFTVCLNDDKLMVLMSGGTTGDGEDAIGADSPPDFMVSEDITAKHGGKRAGLGFAGGLASPRAGTRWHSFELHIHKNDKSDCPACLDCTCNGPPPDEFDVTIEGITDQDSECCDNCADLNETYSLRYSASLSTSTVCVWEYTSDYSVLWFCNFPSGSPCEENGPYQVDSIRLTITSGTDEEDNPICKWKLAFVALGSTGYYGSMWIHWPEDPCTCDLVEAEFSFGGHEEGSSSAGWAGGPYGTSGETVLDPDGRPQSRQGEASAAAGGIFFSDVCDVETTATVTVSVA